MSQCLAQLAAPLLEQERQVLHVVRLDDVLRYETCAWCERLFPWTARRDSMLRSRYILAPTCSPGCTANLLLSRRHQPAWLDRVIAGRECIRCNVEIPWTNEREFERRRYGRVAELCESCRDTEPFRRKRRKAVG